jgi:hypothetical protein
MLSKSFFMLCSSSLFLEPPSLLFDLDPPQLLSRSSYLQLNLSLPFQFHQCSSLLLSFKLSCRLPFNLKLSLLLLLKGDLLLSLPLNLCFELTLLSLLLFLLLPEFKSFKFYFALFLKL